MKKIIIIMLGILFLIGIVFAGSLLNKTDSQLTIDKAKVDAIKTTGISSINVKASPMTCDDKECWADINQPNLIQTQFRTPKQYCTQINKTTECINYEQVCKETKDVENTVCIEYGEKEECIKYGIEIIQECIKYGNGNCIQNSTATNECLAYADYTATELISMRDAYVKQRLESYADSIIAIQSKSGNTQIDDGGVLTSK